MVDQLTNITIKVKNTYLLVPLRLKVTLPQKLVVYTLLYTD